MTIVTKNSLTISNVNDGTITHYAYAYSADGTDRFTTTYPNLNLLDGTKGFSGTWVNLDSNKWITDGTYKNLVVKKRTTQWQGLYKIFTAPIDGTFTFSAYVKASGNTTSIYRYGIVNGITQPNKRIGTEFDWLIDSVTVTLQAGQTAHFRYEIATANTDAILWTAGHKWEQDSIATPHMPSASEVTSADWPSYIGQYTDFTQADSTNPSAYTWSLIRGNDGATGPQGPQGNTGPQGPAGSNGDPGKIVSDTEPTTRFKGLTWKYSGTADLTASDGTVIKPNTEYYFNGKNWMINFLSANNIDANSITAEKINGTDLEVKNGTFTDGVIETIWKNGTVAGSTNIENDHLIITRTDSSVNTTNSIGLDSIQGLIMVYTDNSTGRTISVGTNFQGMFLTDSTGISASISPAGVKLSSDVNWTQIGNIGGRRAEWKRENNRVTMNIHGGNGDRFPVVTSGGTLLGILPTNARPPSDISMPATAQGSGATAQISINSTGEVRCYRWGGDSVYFGAYISYYVE